MAKSGKYDLDKIRNQVKKRVGKHNDPSEFKPPKAEDGKPSIKFRFFILPPFQEGEPLVNGPAARGMGEFFLRHGSHYIDNKRLGCPRVINDAKCGICQHGFDLMGETENKDERRGIAQKLLPGTYMMVNIYFLDEDPNPQDLRGQVKWYNCPKTVFDMWEDCLYRDDDGGDSRDPLPYGVFYDEEDAYLFQLDVVKQGQANSYTASRFSLSESCPTLPLAGSPDKPDADKIAKILAARHDLFDKLPEVSMADIDRITRDLAGEDSAGSSGGFDSDENKSKPADKPASKPANKSTKSKSSDEPPFESAGEPAGDSVAGEMPVEEQSSSAAGADDDDVDALLDQLSDG